MESSRSITCTVVGDEAVGKTSLLLAFGNRRLPLGRELPSFGLYPVNLLVEKEEVTLSIWDSSGRDGHDLLRTLAYRRTNVFLVCFSVTDRSSLGRIQKRWIPEVRRHDPNAAVVLVGLKTDLRGSGEATERRKNLVSPEDGQRLAAKWQCRYAECSAFTQDGVNQVFDLAIETAFRPRTLVHYRRSRCTIL